MQNCERCGFKKFWKTEKTTIVKGVRVRVWQCRRCGEEKAGDIPFLLRPPKKLYFDIEYGLSEYLSFGRYIPSKYLSMDDMTTEGCVLCFAAAWLDEDDDMEFQQVFGDSLRQKEVFAGDDRRILEWLWKELDRADYWIGHNSDAYDIKLVKYRFHKWGMGFPFQGKQVDSLKLAKKHLKAPSFKLDDLARLRGANGKNPMTKDDWRIIAKTGDPETLLKMEAYCRQDVRIGARWFKELVRDIEMSGEKVWK